MQPELASVFITEELARRGQLRPRLFQEWLPMRDLARAMIDDPQRLLPVLVDSAIDQCEAVSGGISLYEPEPAPGVFRWHHLRGELKKFAGETAPRFFSPCGVTIDQRKPVLVQRPERVYTWLQDANVSLPECLLVPLYRGADEPLGTLWLVAKNEGHFDANHAEIATEMASFAGLALRMADHDSQLQAALQRQEMLAREMSHRLKNVLAVVRALLNIGAQQEHTAQELAHAMQGQLQALSAAHDLVQLGSAEAAPSGVRLSDLLSTILRPYRAHKIGLEGPDIDLGRNATNVLALVFHELATNAAKYGALSSVDGKLELRWRQDVNRLHLQWEESGGPAIQSTPASEGFGSLLAAKSIGALKGSLSYEWAESGLIATVELPMDRLAS
jgi:two-component sensor histidine kinase